MLFRSRGESTEPTEQMTRVEDSSWCDAGEAESSGAGGRGTRVEPTRDVGDHVQGVAVVVETNATSGADAGKNEVRRGLAGDGVQIRRVGPGAVRVLIVEKIAAPCRSWTDGDETVGRRVDGGEVEQHRTDATRGNARDTGDDEVVVRRIRCAQDRIRRRLTSVPVANHAVGDTDVLSRVEDAGGGDGMETSEGARYRTLIENARVETEARKIEIDRGDVVGGDLGETLQTNATRVVGDEHDVLTGPRHAARPSSSAVGARGEASKLVAAIIRRWVDARFVPRAVDLEHVDGHPTIGEGRRRHHASVDSECTVDAERG